MKKNLIAIILSIPLFMGCTPNKQSLDNTILDNVLNNARTDSMGYAVHEDRYYYYSFDQDKIVSKKIGSEKLKIEKKYAGITGEIEDINISGSNLIYLEMYMRRGFEEFYQLSSYNFDKNKTIIDFSALNEKLLNSSHEKESYYSITDILVIEDEMLMNVKKYPENAFSDEILSKQYIYNLNTGILKELNIKNFESKSRLDNSVKFLGYYYTDTGDKRFLYEARRTDALSSTPIGYFDLSEENDIISNYEIKLLGDSSRVVTLSDQNLVFTDYKGTFIMNLRDYSMERIWDDMAYGAVGAGNIVYVSFMDGLYLFNMTDKKAKKLIEYDGVYDPTLYKFNNMIYCALYDEVYFKYDMLVDQK